MKSQSIKADGLFIGKRREPGCQVVVAFRTDAGRFFGIYLLDFENIKKGRLRRINNYGHVFLYITARLLNVRKNQQKKK